MKRAALLLALLLPACATMTPERARVDGIAHERRAVARLLDVADELLGDRGGRDYPGPPTNAEVDVLPSPVAPRNRGPELPGYGVRISTAARP
jgi:hypothetical protein